jgi:FlaA1/EpsC-like NDP-sugar epimerase
MRSLYETFRGKRILVTGGTGSIGSQIVRSLLRYRPALVRVLSRDETRQVELRDALKSPRNVSFTVGDIRDSSALSRAIEGIQFIFHAAALKQVPICEQNPLEAVLTNAVGAHNVAQCALAAKVSKVVAVSTDKAVEPISVMGATKLLMERIVLAAQKKSAVTKFCVVRFGNVIASRGSFVPLVISHLKSGRPVTLTHEDMTRFVMTIPDACNLMLRACASCQGGEVFVLKMGRVRISEMLKVIIEEFAPKFGLPPQEVKTVVTGIRDGEKLSERLISSEESLRVKDRGKMLVVEPACRAAGAAARVVPSSDEGDFLGRDEIVRLLRKSGILPRQ